jgi:hypothetical protein
VNNVVPAFGENNTENLPVLNIASPKQAEAAVTVDQKVTEYEERIQAILPETVMLEELRKIKANKAGRHPEFQTVYISWAEKKLGQTFTSLDDAIMAVAMSYSTILPDLIEESKERLEYRNPAGTYIKALHALIKSAFFFHPNGGTDSDVFIRNGVKYGLEKRSKETRW